MKCLLINPPISDSNDPRQTFPVAFPHGLGYVATALAKAGIEVEVLDIYIHKMSKAQVTQKLGEVLPRVDFVGISGIINGFRYIRWLVLSIKACHPQVPVVLGGSICGPNPELLLGSTDVDICCIGEGEETAVDIARVIAGDMKPEQVLGIAYRQRDKVVITPPRPLENNLARFDFPHWKAFDMEKYVTAPPTIAASRHKRNMTMVGTRGCPYHCHFCSPGLGRKVRTRPIQSILDELGMLVDRYGIEHFEFVDELFFINEDFTRAFCSQLIDAGLSLTWRALGRVNILHRFSEGTFALIKESGCHWMGFGMESGSQKILDRMNKGITPEQTENVIRKTRKAGIRFSGNFIFGYPGETRETIRETVEFCKRNQIYKRDFTYACPLPGSRLYDECVETGLIKDQVAYWEQLDRKLTSFIINLTEFSDQELQDLKDEALREIQMHTAGRGRGVKKGIRRAKTWVLNRMPAPLRKVARDVVHRMKRSFRGEGG
ncbi:MAG: B12-binding domain-containing radical SAM protein [Planctomycetota bacterium]|jgi:radical SAM superfamily enzyme YgiQ (UPF0313 family)